jgi:tetratricopeptide (TPR) repeat protein
MIGRTFALIVLFLVNIAKGIDDIESSKVRRVVVGTAIYDEPFSGYQPAIHKVLLKHGLRQGDYYNQADWYIQLALAHRSLFEDDPVLKDWKTQLQLSLNSFQQAIQIYQGLKLTADNDDNPLWLIQHHLAAAYFQIGETYLLTLDQAAAGQDYLVQSEALYRIILKNPQSGVDRYSLREIQIGWAMCCTRLAVTLLQKSVDGKHESSNDYESSLMSELEAYLQEQQQSDPSAAMEAWFLQHPEKVDVLAQKQKRQELVYQRAQDLLQTAIDILRPSVLEKDGDKLDNLALQRQLAAALQNAGTAKALQGDLPAAVEALEEALQIQQGIVVPTVSVDSLEAQDAVAAVAEALYSLADYYVQLGKYEESNERYFEAMEWYNSYSDILEPPVGGNPLLAEVDLEMLSSYEELLLQYREVLTNGLDDVDMIAEGRENEGDYGEDDGYEGDIHTTLGTLYMSQGDYILAESHLTQAVRLYELIGEAGEHNAGDAKFNLAMVRFHNKEYMESAELRRSALEIYRQVVGEGVNPMMQGVYQLDLPTFGIAHGSGSRETVARHVRASDRVSRKGDSPMESDASSDHQTKDVDSTTSVSHATYETIVNLDDYHSAMMNASIKEEL